MIRRVEALGYRGLRYCRQDIGAFHVLVGPNARVDLNRNRAPQSRRLFAMSSKTSL
jgi:hypothetical protein